MAYKNIPVDDETYLMLLAICEVHERKQGAQMKTLVKAEYERLENAGLLKAEGKKVNTAKRGDVETPKKLM